MTTSRKPQARTWPPGRTCCPAQRPTAAADPGPTARDGDAQWPQRDGSAASALAEVDDELDELHASLVAELASGQMTPPVMMEMTLVARLYERLGDHAVNIAHQAICLVGSTHVQPLTVSR